MDQNRRETILIVDDIPQDVDILNELLIDYKRIIALNGKKALQIIEEHPPDLILLDIIMPGIDGHYVCSRIKNNETTKDIPIIFLTAMDKTEDKIKGFELGAVDYITKPFQPEEVVTRIKTHLQLSNYKKRLENINEELQEMVEERTKELFAEKEKALESCRLKSHFLMLMSHELRTPMAGMLGFTEILMNEIDSEDLKNITKLLYSSANRLKATINSILNLSKLESSKPIPHLAVVDITEELKSFILPHELTAREKGLQLIYEPVENRFYSELDTSMFEIIMNNIIGNAIKFTTEGFVKITTCLEDNMISISVSDTGIGVPEEKHDIIFEEFRQADEGVSRNFQGIGLGLSLVKKYVELLNGKIIFKSELNVGTTFTVKFPAIASNTAKNILDKRSSLAEQSKIFHKSRSGELITNYKILLVEDDLMNIAVVKRYLQDHTLVDATTDGLDALKLARENEYSAFIMDINLGTGKSGIDVTKEIKQMPKYANTPIIAYTAFAMDGDKETFLKAGCSHYISKPCSKQEFLDVLLCAIE